MSLMRRFLLPLVVLGLVVSCGEASNGDGASSTASSGGAVALTTAAAPPPPRLACPGEVRSFQPVSGPIGGPDLPTFLSPEEGAQYQVDQSEDVESAVLVGEEDAGTRFALLDATGTVVSEAVYAQSGSTWRAVRFDSCAP